jgi:hypothetical protein
MGGKTVAQGMEKCIFKNSLNAAVRILTTGLTFKQPNL